MAPFRAVMITDKLLTFVERNPSTNISEPQGTALSLSTYGYRGALIACFDGAFTCGILVKPTMEGTCDGSTTVTR